MQVWATNKQHLLKRSKVGMIRKKKKLSPIKCSIQNIKIKITEALGQKQEKGTLIAPIHL